MSYFSVISLLILSQVTTPLVIKSKGLTCVEESSILFYSFNCFDEDKTYYEQNFALLPESFGDLPNREENKDFLTKALQEIVQKINDTAPPSLSSHWYYRRYPRYRTRIMARY